MTGTRMALIETFPQQDADAQVVLVAPDIYVVDNLLADFQRKPILHFLRDEGWKFGWKSHSKTDVFSFWHKHFAGYRNGRKEDRRDCADELRRNSPLLYAYWRYLASTVLEGQMLIRCYANAHSYGSDGTIHTDSKHDDSFTSVYYPHDAWEPNWAGETVLFNDDRTDIVASIYPQSNRLLLFRSNIPHVARGVSRICPQLRVTLMCKTGMPDDRRRA